MGIVGRATAMGTARYAARLAGSAATQAAGEERTRASASPLPPAPHLAALAEGHFRSALGLTLSSIGCGTYLGDVSDITDSRYRVTLAEAVRCGCNVLDTAVNYRAQRSEITVGQAVADLITAGEAARDELVIATKGGFVTYRLVRPANPAQYVHDTFIATGIIEPGDLAGGIHCMAPDYLSQQISWSLRNTSLHTLDIYYLHNPETQLAFVDRATFRKRLQLAFARLEEEVAGGRIGCYGVATWEALRRPPISADYMSLEILVQLVTEVAGPSHHLRAVQLPVNVAITSAATFRNQAVKSNLLPVVEAARDLGLVVIASAAIGQAQLSKRQAIALAQAFPALPNTLQRALQFTRSLPGVATALVGMGHPEHARENLALAAFPPEPQMALRLAHLLAR